MKHNYYELSPATPLIQAEFVREQIHRIPYALAKKRRILPLYEEEGILMTALCDPLDFEAIEDVRCITGKQIQIVVASPEDIDAAIEACYHQKKGSASDLIAELKEIGQSQGEVSNEYDLLAQVSDAPVIKLLNMILAEAIQQGASDIHFEPQEEELSIRYRLDGVLQTRHSPPRELQAQLITRIKVMAQMDIAEHRLPQDGRIKLAIGGRSIDFRVSTIPVVYGERVVLRILDKTNIVLGLHRLGMLPDILRDFQRSIHLSEGIVLVTGPTGSGKTTTLYSALVDIASSEVNIMTIEDPVEYKLSGMAQMGVNPKISLDFATGLRHILRQDPDVIMIGEIRDQETAEIAIQASLTGHLVFSTLHTNDAPSALTRLVDMGIEPYLLSSSVLAVLAQRLVRMICPHCKKAYAPSQEELRDLGLPYVQELFRGEGCNHCFGSGYRGRYGIYELMLVTPRIKRQVMKSADAAELRMVAESDGMQTLRSSGIHLVTQGITTVAEVLRVSRGCEGDL